MKKDKSIDHIEQVKNEDVEVTDKAFRAERLGTKGRVRKMRARVESSDGDFRNTIQHDGDLEDYIRCNGNLRTTPRDD